MHLTDDQFTLTIYARLDVSVQISKGSLTDALGAENRHRNYTRRGLNDAAIVAAAANCGKGWAFIPDGAREAKANALSIPADQRTLITIDGLGSFAQGERDTIPLGHDMVQSGRFMPVEYHDRYLLGFRFMAEIMSASTEQPDSVLVEYEIAPGFVLKSERKTFAIQPGPVRARRNDMAATRTVLGGVLGAAFAVIDARIAGFDAELAAMSGAEELIGVLMTVFVGNTFMANGMAIYVTPTTDIKLWAPDLDVTRLSSPTT